MHGRPINADSHFWSTHIWYVSEFGYQNRHWDHVAIEAAVARLFLLILILMQIWGISLQDGGQDRSGTNQTL